MFAAQIVRRNPRGDTGLSINIPGYMVAVFAQDEENYRKTILLFFYLRQALDTRAFEVP